MRDSFHGMEFFFFLLLLLIFNERVDVVVSGGECLSVPYMVVLGASMVDVGENAVAMPLRSLSEFPPYGLDYFPSPAARYSNGRLFIDILTQDLGHGLLHPYLYSLDSNFSHGVNFASSGSTVRNSTLTGTGQESGGLFSFLVQVDQLAIFLAKVKAGSVPKLPTREMVEGAMVFIETGLNDYLRHAYVTPSYDPVADVESTVATMELGIRRLLDMGMKKLVVMNLIPMGCTPGCMGNKYYLSFERDSHGCVVVFNQLTTLHNQRLAEMVQGKLAPLYPSSKLLVFDAHSLYLHAMLNPSTYGIKYPIEACCGYYYSGTCITCGKSGYVDDEFYESKRCNDPSIHIYWDYVHPTEAFGQHIANAIHSGSHLIPSYKLQHSCVSQEHSSM